jgi:hypothetical protein
MLNMKMSVFIACLIVSALGGVVGSRIVINVFAPEPEAVACEPVPAAVPERNTFRHVDPVNTGRDKGY